MNSSVSIRWSPHSTPGNQRFLKINTTQQELCLYDFTNEKGKGTQCRLVSKHPKVPYIRCFDWSPTQEDLVSVGQSSGETLLYRLSTRASIPLRVKHQRSCNSVSFNSSGALLATALDKVRNDFCLNIWDIAASYISANQGGIARSSWQLASSEAIPSVRFLRKDPDVLICGVAYRWIRCYDIRKSPVTTVFAVPHRCAQGLSLDLDSNYFASHSDDGVIAVWDRRHLGYGGPTHEPRPALLFNRAEEYGRQGSPIASLRYSNTKPGTFAVLNTSGGLRIYDTGKIADGDPPLGQGLFGPGVIAGGVQPSGRKGWRDSAASLLDGARMNGGGGTASGARTPNVRIEPGETLFVTRIKDIQSTPVRTTKNDRRIVSFDWMSDCGSEDIRTICLRNDGTPVVMSCSGSATSLAFGSRNGLLITHGKDLKVLPSPSTALTLPLEAEAAPEEASVDSPVGSPPGTGIRLGMHEGRRLGRSNSIARPEDFLYDAAEMLKNDICVVMRRRVEAGYEMDCAKNITLVSEEPELQEMWQWLQGATEAAANGGMVAGILDLSYMGVLGIWNNGTGLGPSAIANMATRNLSSPLRTPTQPDWTAAISEINRRAKRSPFTGRTKFPEQRRLALAIAGWDFAPSELEAHLAQLETAGEVAKAAGWALFHGETERCIATLGRGGQQMKIMSTAVAGYYSHATLAQPTAAATAESVKNAGIWKDLCRAMSVELDEPYLRAVFAYVANGEWRDVLDDVGLPIRERLGIALRWLEDAELTGYLGGLAERVVGDGDVDGIVLTGVGGRVGELLQVYVNRKGDVQTASLVAGLTVPRYDEDERVGYWVESYRQLLNSWRLFHARAKFDVARGKHSRNRGGVMTVPEVQRQVYVRCTYCDRNISYGAPTAAAKPAGTSKPHMNPREITQAPTSLAGVNAATKATVCPQCKKSLPRCAVCLLNLGTKYYKKSAEGGVVRGAEDGKSTDPAGEFDRWFNFCLSCNHGMHSGHAREWFARHVLCPVPECDCRCKM